MRGTEFEELRNYISDSPFMRFGFACVFLFHLTFRHCLVGEWMNG